MLEAVINTGFFFAAFLAGFALFRILPNRPALTCVLVILPYLIVLRFILLRRRTGHPFFAFGSPAAALSSYPLGWIMLAALFTLGAFHNGLLRPLSLVGYANQLSAIVEAPLVEEFVFRGALLASLNKTRLGSIRILRVEASIFLAAIIFSSIHLMLFMAANEPVSDALVSTLTAFIPGLIFGIIYQRTQNIWYGVFLHALSITSACGAELGCQSLSSS